MKLHEAIVEVLRQRGGPMTFQEIADAINQLGLYQKQDGSPVEAGQIRLRTGEKTSGGTYAHLFVRQGNTLRLAE
jgi:hypothetical protein